MSPLKKGNVESGPLSEWGLKKPRLTVLWNILWWMNWMVVSFGLV